MCNKTEWFSFDNLYMWFQSYLKWFSSENAFESILDGSRDCHTEWSQSERETQISDINAYMWNLGKQHTSLFIFLKWQSQNLNQTGWSWAQDLMDLIVFRDSGSSCTFSSILCMTEDYRLSVNSSTSKEAPRKTAHPTFLHSWQRTSTLQI